ncbi:hypothetical protein [Lacisediminihabitans sp.]|jgi:hypothetical protein|uniref:hypothetical protein n=1 Tax=Lacisediminihabitans sp. TaxID=2787631 RepID=UPI002F93A9AD
MPTEVLDAERLAGKKGPHVGGEPMVAVGRHVSDPVEHHELCRLNAKRRCPEEALGVEAVGVAAENQRRRRNLGQSSLTVGVAPENLDRFWLDEEPDLAGRDIHGCPNRYSVACIDALSG